MRRLLFLLLLPICVVLAMHVAERHDLQIDVSAQRSNSLSEAAGQALGALAEGLQITAFVPELSAARGQVQALLDPYLRASARVTLQFVDPLRNPEAARAAGVTRHGELHLRSGRRMEVVAAPERDAIDRALERLALRGERWIVALQGHGELAIDRAPGGLASLVGQLEELGYRVVTLDPRHLERLPENTALLLIAGPQAPYSDTTEGLIQRYQEGGGAALWLLEGEVPELVRRVYGVDLMPGIVVDAAAAQHGLDTPDYAVVGHLPAALLTMRQDQIGLLHQARALTLAERDGWQVRGRLQSSPLSWNETGASRGALARDAERGEQAGPLDVGVALEHVEGASPTRVVIIGGRQFLGNEQVGRGDNLALATGLVRWLTDNRALSATPGTPDLQLRWSPRLGGLLALTLMGLLPLGYLAAGLWLRHRRRLA